RRVGRHPDRREPRRDRPLRQPGPAPARPDPVRVARDPALAEADHRQARRVGQPAARPRPAQGVQAAMNAYRLPLLLCLASLAGCTSVLGVPRQPFMIYAPGYRAPEGAAAAGARVDWQLVVETTLASDTLNTARIVVMPQPGLIEVYPGARP